MDESPAAQKTSLPAVRVSQHLRRLAPVKTISGKPQAKGISAALASAFFLGLAPIFGKQAILFGLPPLSVVAIRTLLAAVLLFLVIAVFARKYLYIYPAGLLGCLLAGFVNGVGSLFYFSSLGRIDASIGHLLYSLYPLFLVIWLSLDRQPPGRMTLLRIGLALPAVYLLTFKGTGEVDPIGVIEMLVASALYALHLPINQRVLYDMPAPTVTLYTLIAMSAIVVPAFLFSGASGTFQQVNLKAAGWPLVGLALATFFSRLTLFLGVKHLGGMQTALLGLGELLVMLFFAQLWLGERFSPAQWLGAGLLLISLILVVFDKTPARHSARGWLGWLRPPGFPADFPWQSHD